MKCKCGSEIVRAEVRLVGRCRHGHFSSSRIQPQSVGLGVLHEPITDGQIRALNGKAGALDKLLDLKAGTSKAAALAAAGVEHTKDLDAHRASEVLDKLEEQLLSARAA